MMETAKLTASDGLAFDLFGGSVAISGNTVVVGAIAHDVLPGPVYEQGAAYVFAVAVCGNSVVETGEQCDDGNVANGDCCSSTCRYESSGTVCRPDGGACDVQETCTGSSATCPVDGFEPNTTTCDDGNACTSTGNVQGGPDYCAGTANTCDTAAITCSNDGNVCTVDACVAGFCNTPGNAGTVCATRCGRRSPSA